jgi:hypothetical protein
MPRSTLPDDRRKVAGIVVKVTPTFYDEYRAACIVADTSMSRHVQAGAKALIEESKKDKAAWAKALRQAKAERNERESNK